MAVPRPLVDRVRKHEVKVSLQTSDPLAAKVRSRLLSNAFDVLFSELQSMPAITTAIINDRIRGYFQACLNQSFEHTQLLPTDPFVDLEKEVAYSIQVGFRSPKTAFHSFRHNFKDALQNAKVPEFASRALMGHADKSVHSQYGSGPSLSMLKEEVDKVDYQVSSSLPKA